MCSSNCVLKCPKSALFMGVVIGKTRKEVFLSIRYHFLVIEGLKPRKEGESGLPSWMSSGRTGQHPNIRWSVLFTSRQQTSAVCHQLRLKIDEIGVISVPSVQSVKTPEEETNRDVRMKRREVRIVNSGECAWNPTEFFVVCFCWLFWTKQEFQSTKMRKNDWLFFVYFPWVKSNERQMNCLPLTISHEGNHAEL